jgi:hypothetical protein
VQTPCEHTTEEGAERIWINTQPSFDRRTDLREIQAANRDHIITAEVYIVVLQRLSIVETAGRRVNKR